MTIDKTSRKEALMGNGSSGQVFTVPFSIENKSDLVVYDPSGNIQRDVLNYNITGHGLAATTTNTTTVTWVGTSPVGSLTFHRTSDRSQPLSVASGFSSGDIEAAFDRITLAGQNAIRQVNSVYDLSSEGLLELGTPTDDSDAATVGYAQDVYSKKGYICPGVLKVDTGKALYSSSTSTVRWGDPFDVPYPSANTKILQVNGLGAPTWVDPVNYAPTYPTDEPKYLSILSESTTWRTVKQVPSLAKGNYNDTLVYQYGDTYAWEPIRWLEPAPSANKYIYNSTGTGVGGAVGPTTTTLYASAKCTSIWEEDTDSNHGGETKNFVRGKTGEARIALLEWDLSGLTAADYSIDTLVSVYLRIWFTTGSSTSARTFVIKRLKNAFVDGTGTSGNSYNDDGATWEKPTAPSGGDWLWNSGNFDPAKELDHELPVPTFDVGSGMTTGDYTYIDIKHLFLDALKNRDGILRIAMYDPAPTSSVRYAKFFSNSGNANDVKLEVANAAARTTGWQGWNYQHLSDVEFQDCPAVEGYDSYSSYFSNPHISQIKTQILDVSFKGGHQTDGLVATCAYTTGWDDPATFIARDSFLHAFAINSNGNGRVPGFFVDHTFSSHQDIDHTQNRCRVSTFWMEDE